MPLLCDLASLVQQNAQALEAALAAMNGGTVPDLSFQSAEPAMIDDPAFIPSVEAFDLMEKLRTSLRALESAFTPTKEKHVKIAMASFKTRALHVAVELGLSDAIDAAGGEVDVKDLARSLDVHPNKLGNLMRILACEDIYVERRPGVFANSRHSIGLRDSAPGARPMLSFLTGETHDATGALYKNLTDKEHRYNFSAGSSAFSLSVGKGQPFTVFLGDHPDVAQKVVFGVVPWLNTITRPALIYDYPWQALGESTVVDLGCGPGDVGVDMLKTYPKLRWIYQDLPAAMEATKPTLEKNLAAAGAQDRAQMVAQDYFEPNRTIGDAYFLRGVLRDYDDAEAARILQGVSAAMKGRPGTRLLINEIITGPPDSVDQQPYGTWYRSAALDIGDTMAVNAFTVFGGMERSWPEMEALLTSTGFIVEHVHRLRTFTVMIECRLPN